MSKAYKKLEIDKLDKDLLKKFYVLLDDLEILNNSMFISDNNNHEKLVELNNKITKIISNPKDLILYRGFDNGFQDNLGFLKDDINKQKKITFKRDVSFSLDKEIAEGFGSNILSTVTNNKTNFLYIHDELSYIIQKEYRNIKDKDMQTQKEIIVFKDNILNIKLIQRNEKPKWILW